MMLLGVDPHKDTHTVVAVDQAGRQLGQITVAALLCRTDRAFRIVCDQARAPRSPPSRSGRPFRAQPVIYGVSPGRRPADSLST
jgi:hypothetical protein